MLIPDALNCPPDTDTDEIVTAELPEAVKVTVLVAVCPTLMEPNATLELLRESEPEAAFNWMLKPFEDPLAEAVMFTVCIELTAVAVAEKLAEVPPAATVTDAGTETAVLLLFRRIASPPAGAAALSEIVHGSVPAPLSDALVHVSELITGIPVPERLIAVVPPVEELLLTVS